MENTEQMSLLEIAVQLVEERKGLYNIKELIRDTLAVKGISEDNTDAAVQLYVDMTASSKFVYMGDDNWDLKANQPLEAFDKDGSSFISKDEEYVPEEEEEEFFDDAEDEINESDEDDEDEDSKSEYIDDEDNLDDEEDDKKSDDGELDSEDTERYSEDDYNEDDYSDDDEFNEDKYNDLMDDYEDMYDDK